VPSLPAPAPAWSTPDITSIWSNAPTSSQQATAPAEADWNTCDKLAGNRYDPQRSSEFEGVPFAILAGFSQTAIAACERAAKAFPNEPRIRYQLARAMQAANEYDRAFPVLIELARGGYPASFDNIAFHYSRQNNIPLAIEWHRRGADAGDAEAMVKIAKYIEKGLARPRYRDEFWELLAKAAELGHEGARKAISERQPAWQGLSNLSGTIIDIFNRNLRR
jgi:TPR repeat protein